MKKLSRTEMKALMGGNVQEANCTAAVNCPNGHTYTCAGNSHTSSDGSALGCSAQDGVGATCYYQEGGTTHYATVSCTGQMGLS